MKLAAATMLVFIPLAAKAQDGPPCSRQVTTMDLAQCIDKDTAVWDKRLNAAYKALGAVVDPEQREPLKAAQRLWIQYRSANCGFYAAHEGTISAILTAECMWRMTRDRAKELELAAKQ